MFGPYGSYSSMGLGSSPMDIGSRSHETSDSCAFPSWPRRDSLSDPTSERPNSYFSDEELLSCDAIDDDARSVSSNGSLSPTHSPPQAMAVADVLELQRQRVVYQRDVMRFLMGEKERRRQQQQQLRQQQQQAATKRPRRSSASPKKSSPKSKLSSMTTIAEANSEGAIHK